MNHELIYIWQLGKRYFVEEVTKDRRNINIGWTVSQCYKELVFSLQDLSLLLFLILIGHSCITH